MTAERAGGMTTRPDTGGFVRQGPIDPSGGREDPASGSRPVLAPRDAHAAAWVTRLTTGFLEE